VPTVQQMCAEVRLRVDEPRNQRPSARRALQAVTDSLQTFYARLGNTGQAWSLKPDYQLVVSSGVSDYLLAIDNSYGKPLQVLTYYTLNPSYIQRYVEFVEFNDLNFNWNLPQNIASWMWTDGSPNTAMRMAFYYKDDGSRWVRVLPQPQLAATYLISFASGDWASNASLTDSPVLSQFHSLPETWAALSILPSCEWWDDKKANMDHRRELALSLSADMQRMEDEFDRYCRNLVDDHMTVRTSSFDSNDAGGWW